MILPDVNLLVYAVSGRSKQHEAARAWLNRILNDREPVGWSWAAMLGFLRVSTNSRVTSPPVEVTAASGAIRGWLARPNSRILAPTPQHGEIVFGLLERAGTSGNLVADAHLAALSIEYDAEVHSADGDFGKFEGVRWRNPLED